MAIVEQNYWDLYPIPDEENCGLSNPSSCTNVLITSGTFPCGIVQRTYGEGKISIDLANATNTALSGTYIIENYDFTGITRAGLNNQNSYSGSGLIIKFINCKFNRWEDLETYHTNTLLKCEFVDCEILYFAGCESTSNYCKYGTGGGSDPIHPGHNSHFHHCYIRDVVHPAETQGAGHVDGMQSNDPINLTFVNCRWEVPNLNFTTSDGLSNVAFYIQPTQDCYNILIDHCIFNGGNYTTITILSKQSTGGIFENVIFTDSMIGTCYRTSPYYDSFSESIATNTIGTNKLYVSTVRKKESTSDLEFYVTNDTNTQRKLLVYTNLGVYEYTVPKCPKFNQLTKDATTFQDLPFNIYKTINEDVEYAIFFDTAVSLENQLRFVNYTENEIEFPQNFYNIPCSVELLLHRRRMFLNILNSSNPVIQPNRNLINVAIKSTPTQIVTSASAQTYEFILEPNTTYNITKDSTLVSRYGYLPSAYTTGTATLYDGTIPTWNNAGIYQFTTPSTYTYFYFTYTLYEAVKTITIQKA